MTETIYIRRGDAYINAGTIDVVALATPEPIPDPPTVGTDAELRAAIEAWEPGGEPIYVQAGATFGPVDVTGKHGLAIEAWGGRAAVSGLVPFTGEWTQAGNLITAPYTGFPGRAWHWSKSSGTGDMHRRSACPDNFALVQDGQAQTMRLVHTTDDLFPGSYLINLRDGDPNKPTHVVVYLPAGFERGHVHHAPTPFLLRGEETNGVRIRGLDFQFCGDTHKSGGVQITGEAWDVDATAFACMVGFYVRGTGHNLNSSRAMYCHQLGFFLDRCHDGQFPACSAEGNNVRGANARWEAGGLKMVNSTGNTFGLFTATQNDGPGHWADIHCHKTTLLSYRGWGNLAADVQIEHHMTGGEYRDLECDGTRPYWLEADRSDVMGFDGPAGKEKIGSLWMQSNLAGVSVIGARFDNTPLAVKIKEHESRGVVSGCTLDGFEYGAGVVQRKSIERFTDAQIRAAISQGAKPATLAEWQAVRNTYGASV